MVPHANTILAIYTEGLINFTIMIGFKERVWEVERNKARIILSVREVKIYLLSPCLRPERSRYSMRYIIASMRRHCVLIFRLTAFSCSWMYTSWSSSLGSLQPAKAAPISEACTSSVCAAMLYKCPESGSY